MCTRFNSAYSNEVVVKTQPVVIRLLGAVTECQSQTAVSLENTLNNLLDLLQ